MEGVFLLFSFGGGEIMIILLFVIMFFGSKRIPEIARTLGKGIKEVRNATNEIKREIRDQSADLEDNAAKMTKGFYNPGEEVKEVAGSVRRSVRDILKEDPPMSRPQNPNVPPPVAPAPKPESKSRSESTSPEKDDLKD